MRCDLNRPFTQAIFDATFVELANHDENRNCSSLRRFGRDFAYAVKSPIFIVSSSAKSCIGERDKYRIKIASRLFESRLTLILD